MITEKETDIQKAICDYLALKNYFFWRSNNVPIYSKDLQRYRSLPKYAMLGIPDIILVKEGGHVVFLEVKRGGGRLSVGQELFRGRCNDLSIPYHIVRSLDDVIELGL